MSDAAGFICRAEDVREALAGARALNARIKAEGVACSRPYEAARAVQWRQMAIASEAVLTALDFYIQGGGGSRGARAICDPTGELTPMTQTGALSEFRFLPERKQDRETGFSSVTRTAAFPARSVQFADARATIRRFLSATGRAS